MPVLPHFSRRNILTGFGIGAGGLLLAACGGSPPPPIYDLSAARDKFQGRGGVRGQILVYEPSAIALYDTERLVIKGTTQGLTYLPGAQWADRLPKLVQSRIIQSFENSNRFKSIGRPGDHISATALLNTEIRAFEVEEQTRQALVEISAKLVSQGSGRIETGKLFTARIPVATIDGAGASAALDEALRVVLSQIVSWAAGN